MTPDQQREFLALSFEPAEDGYVYYHRRWSQGIPVTAEERLNYLKIPAFGSRRAWLRSIADRPSLPPRSYGPTSRKLHARLPISMLVAGLLIGTVLTASGVSGFPSLPAVVCLVCGLAFIGFAAKIGLAKIALRNNP